jgi:hypothetical protein
MYKSNKGFWGVIIGLIILVIAAVIVTALFLDTIVKKGVETVGPQITKVSVNLDEVHLDLLTGSASIKGLVIGNPDGYKSPDAISVGLVKVGVDPLSIFSDKIVVHSVVVQSPEITFEGGLGGNNLSTIMDNVNGGGKGGGPVSASAAPAKPAKKIEVDDFLITGAKVHVSLTGVGGGKEMTLPLPDIHLTDLGKGTDGIDATDLTRRVLEAITAATIKTVANDATDIGRGAQNLGGKGVDKIKSGLGGLLGK